jgi:hypothetical protein
MRRTDEDRDRLCNDLYDGEKSRNFMLHMVRAYSKLDKIKKIVEFGEKQRRKCTICDVGLLSIDEAVRTLAENGKAIAEDMASNLKAQVDGAVAPDHPLAKYYKGKTLAYGADGTDTCVCLKCATAIHRFTLRKLLDGDRSVNRTVKDMIDRENGVSREPRRQHDNVYSGQRMGDLPGFDKLLRKFGK